MKTILILFSIFCTSYLFAQEDLSVDLTNPKATAVTPDDGFISIHTIENQIVVYKFNSLGNEDWNVAYITGWLTENNTNDITYSIQMKDGFYLIVEENNLIDPAIKNNTYIVKIDALGSIVKENFVVEE